MTERDRFSSYTFGEGRTAIGQHVKFSCPIDSRELVEKFFAENVRSIDLPVTGQVNVPHGGYGRYTRYNITQHKYAGGRYGYIEVLEILDTPDNRCGIVIYEFPGNGKSSFSEWETLEEAKKAFEKFWRSEHTEEEFQNLPGYKRRVVCGYLTPWFYAVGTENLFGDYALPYGLEDDPTFRIGEKFLVFDESGAPAIKTCLGTVFVKRKNEYNKNGQDVYRLVHWSDGSTWSDERQNATIPRLIRDDEAWITEAIHQFSQLLSGDKNEFTINFIGGHKFVGKIIETKKRKYVLPGDYLISAQVEGEKTARVGWVKDFKPTDEFPDVIEFTRNGLSKKGLKALIITVKQYGVDNARPKKWPGIFFEKK